MPVLEFIRKSVPPPADSEDFTMEEAKFAIPVANEHELLHRVEEHLLPTIRPNVGGAVQHALKRYLGQMFYKITVQAEEGPDKVLIFRLDWYPT